MKTKTSIRSKYIYEEIINKYIQVKNCFIMLQLKLQAQRHALVFIHFIHADGRIIKGEDEIIIIANM